jgi:hypothetical protein
MWLAANFFGNVLEPHIASALRTTGGLRPPLLVARCWFASEMTIFPIRERIFTRAAGVSPPWFGHPGVVRSESRNVRRLANTESRAATVSPPWFGHPGVVRPESRDVRRLAHAESRAATVSPPWVLGKCTCRNAAAKSRETAIGALTNPGAVAVAKPRGAYAPRSCVAVRMSAGEKRFLRWTNAGSTKSGGRQPAVRVTGRTLSVMCWKRTCKRRSETTGGLRPPLLRCCANVRRQKNDLCDAQTQVQPRAAGVSPPWFGDPNVVRPESRNVRRLANTESRAAGVSPPWFDNTIGMAADFFGLNTFLHRTFGSPHHGGLTPPAPSCTVLVRQ